MNEDVDRPHYPKIVLAVILFFVLFSMTPTFYEWNARSRIKPERFFELVHNFPTDYNLYLSRIREGREGAWLATEKYTSEPHAPSLLQVMYVLIGRLADYSHIQTPYVWFAYHVARVFFSALLMWVIWLVARWAFADKGFYWQFIAFLLVVTQSTWPKFELVQAVPRLGGWMPWYTMADSMQRTTFMPHVMFAQTLLVFVLWVLSGGFLTRGPAKQDLASPGNYVFLGIVGLVLGIIFPPGLLFVYGVIGIVTVAEAISLWWKGGWTNTRLSQWFVRDVFGRVVFGCVSGPSLIYFYLLLSQYPWKRLAEFDVLHPTAFSFVEYFMAMGPVLPLGLLGIIVLAIPDVRKKILTVPSKLIFFIYWVIAWLGFLFIFDKIPQQSPTRFTQMAPHVPLGILTAYLFYIATQYISTHFLGQKKLSLNHESGMKNHGLSGKRKAFFIIHNSLFILPFVIVLFGMGSMASSYMWLQDFVDHKLRATIPLVPHGAEVMYPLYDIVDALVWLQVYAPRTAIVLSGSATGNYIPVHSGNTAFVGHANTVQSEIKIAAMENFYHKRLSLEEEMGWIKEQHIAYILYGPEEAEMAQVADLRTFYPDLVEVYKNATVRVYKAP